MKVTLFDKTIMPYCTYCEYFTQGRENKGNLCVKFGIIEDYDPCKYYIYAPLKRIPSSFAPLPKFTASDFSLEI